MSDAAQHDMTDNNTINVPASLALKTDGNPEGKGVNALLADWRDSEPYGVVAKPRPQVLAEFFTSMLVLSATMRYRPVVGAENYLYWSNGKWSLSLIAPDEWSAQKRSAFAGTCVLQQDMTWTITLSTSLKDDSPVVDAIVRFYDGFAKMMDTDLNLEDLLPFHNGQVPYFQRLYASALSRSIRAAVTLGEQVKMSGREWRSALPDQQHILPSHASE